jgi:hypothetical protein
MSIIKNSFALLFVFVYHISSGQNCDFYSIENLKLDSSIYMFYNAQYSQFLESKNDIDVYLYKSLGGSNKYTSTRIFKRGERFVVEQIKDGKSVVFQDSSLSFSTKSLSKLGDYIGRCDYTSLNEMYLCLIKVNGHFYLKLASSDDNFELFPNESYKDLLLSLRRYW